MSVTALFVGHKAKKEQKIANRNFINPGELFKFWKCLPAPFLRFRQKSLPQSRKLGQEIRAGWPSAMEK
jgi:hypothetical protein